VGDPATLPALFGHVINSLKQHVSSHSPLMSVKMCLHHLLGDGDTFDMPFRFSGSPRHSLFNILFVVEWWAEKKNTTTTTTFGGAHFLTSGRLVKGLTKLACVHAWTVGYDAASHAIMECWHYVFHQTSVHDDHDYDNVNNHLVN